MKTQLKRPYISVQRGGVHSYGGNQAWCKEKYRQESACGLISAVDLLLYVERKPEEPLSEEEYLRITKGLGHRYFPVIPKVGMIGWSVAFGLNAYFCLHGIALRASWGVRPKRLWERMEEMLEADIPVILTIGPNFPFRWSGHKLNLYTRGVEGTYRAACKVSGHYVNVTGMEEEWLRISSWGREYYVRRAEYTDYVRKYSNYLVCNLVSIQKKRRRKV